MFYSELYDSLNFYILDKTKENYEYKRISFKSTYITECMNLK